MRRWLGFRMGSKSALENVETKNVLHAQNLIKRVWRQVRFFRLAMHFQYI